MDNSGYDLKKKASKNPRRLALLGFSIAMATLIFILLSPLVSLFLFAEGFVQNNPSRISAFVSYPALRKNLKQQFSSYEQRRSRADRSSFGFLIHPLRGAITSAVIDSYVNSSLPSRILGPQRQSPRPSPKTPPKPSPVRYAGFALQGPNRFVLNLRLEVGDHRMKGQVLGLVFSRTTLFKWALTNITLGDPMIHAILKKAQG